MANLTVHHLQISQSERIPWLLEELGLSYTLKNYKRAPLLAPDDYKKLHHSGAAPVIQDGDLTLAESGACVEYICHKYANGKLFVPPSDARYADFLYWWHWTNGTFQPAISRGMAVRLLAKSVPDGEKSGGASGAISLAENKVKAALAGLEARLAENEFLAGSEISVADIMVVFSLTTMRHFNPYSLAGFDNILAYLQRISKREAYQRAMNKSDPDMQLVLGADPPTPLI
jgi:glutathione S-transferase